MVCPKCGRDETDVTNSRYQTRRQQIWRRRKCQACGFTFTTRESHDVSFISVSKRGGQSEQFSKAKLMISLAKACDHMVDQQNIAEALTDTVVSSLLPLPGQSVSSQKIAKAVEEVLRRYNSAALVKYLSFQTDLSNPASVKKHLKSQSDT